MKVLSSWIAATVTLIAGLCVLGLGAAGFGFLLLLVFGKPLFVAGFVLVSSAAAAGLAVALRARSRAPKK